ncbi:DUF4393 domain-containing protein [Trichlorobacter lovleyi]|uniref:Abi-alpha family protein n=1 Tax=Trichlorobacter lovleyi TaxID=313985 RepID=UPI00223F7A87|nr:Abi-alpha family protein [Trichlorobacter lovleyi]QOX79504.1 DUF4393 domain-containing protein [Trichlorobacter lovleyi]
MSLPKLNRNLLPIGPEMKILSEFYKDIDKPSVVATGRAISTAVETSTTFLLPLQLWSEKRKRIFQHNINMLEKELVAAAKQGKTVIPAAPEIANALLDKLTYISDEDLSALFVRLLRRASIEEESGLAHPRFVDIVSSISPDEARILKATAQNDYFRCLSVSWEKIEEDDDGIITKIIYMSDRCLTRLESKITILFPDNVYKYLVSLESLGLLLIHEDTSLDEHLVPSKEYRALKRFYRDRIKDGVMKEDGHVSRVSYGRIQYTEFGLFFLDACVRSNDTVIKPQNNEKKASAEFTSTSL